MKIWNPPVGADARPERRGASRAVRALCRSWPGYALAIVWVVVGALLYAAEVVRLLARLG